MTGPNDLSRVTELLADNNGVFATTLLVLVVDTWGDLGTDADHAGKVETDNNPLPTLTLADNNGDGNGHDRVLKCLTWQASTYAEEFKQTFGVELPAATLDRLMAGIALLTTDGFYNSARQFIAISNVLSGAEFDPRTFDPADVLESAWAVTEAMILAPPDAEDYGSAEIFSPEVRAYMGVALAAEGFVTPPGVLKAATGLKRPALDHPRVREAAEERVADVERALRLGVRNLVGQLRQLPLRNGSLAELERRTGKLLQSWEHEP